MTIKAYNDQIFPIYMELEYFFHGEKKLHFKEFNTKESAIHYFIDMCKDYINIQLDEYFEIAQLHGIYISSDCDELFNSKEIVVIKPQMINRYTFVDSRMIQECSLLNRISRTLRPRAHAEPIDLSNRILYKLEKLNYSHSLKSVRHFLHDKILTIRATNKSMIKAFKKLEV